MRQNCEIERHGAIVKGEDGVGVKPGELILRQEWDGGTERDVTEIIKRGRNLKNEERRQRDLRGKLGRCLCKCSCA